MSPFKLNPVKRYRQFAGASVRMRRRLGACQLSSARTPNSLLRMQLRLSRILTPSASRGLPAMAKLAIQAV